jgi:lipid A 3-O-deacylase
MGTKWRERWRQSLFGAALLSLAIVPAASAAGAGAQADDPPFISIAAGGFDILHNNTAGEFRAEYRFADKQLFIFKPFLGVFGTTDKAFYGYGGIRVDIYLGSRWVLMPNGAFGYYQHGQGKNLGGVAEFRTGAEFAYRFDDRSRLGLSFNHISNAGFYKRNPGEEEAAIVYSIPFNLLK